MLAAADRYVDEMAPWALRKTDIARMGTVLYVLAEVIRHLAIFVQPVMPAHHADDQPLPSLEDEEDGGTV